MVPVVTVVVIRTRSKANTPVTEVYFWEVCTAHAISLPTAAQVPLKLPTVNG